MSVLQQEFDSALPGCSLCHRAIKAGEQVREEVTGWAKRGKQGGLGSTVVGARGTGRVACPECILRLRHKVHPEQLSL